MAMKNNRWMRVVWCCLSCLWLADPAMAADGLFSTVTDDGVTLKMLRYRPVPGATFREDGQPVLLFPGIVCNMNAFLSHTPDERIHDYAGMTLPTPIADWAKDDPTIQADPMRYYSLAHYLWLKGYDVWLANYRGTGRGEFKSDKGNLMTNNDVWGILDVDACVKKVVEVTGKAPFIGGHSTGGFSCYAYLQGASFDLDELR
ncbi:MAG TPA: alpha/beta fold hydrolase, partial [Deltaproteobacteria bacterium]|nr:alpha/beta fold hydrolase [Deltaproteobacteria bacterium]